jgi:hypothetical protein
MMESVYVAGGASAIVVTTIIEMLKRSKKIAWINHDSGRVNATLSAIAALLTGIGLTYSFDFNPESGHFHAEFSGNVWDILNMLGHSFWQWCQQHFAYSVAIKPSEILLRILEVQRDIKRRQGMGF